MSAALAKAAELIPLPDPAGLSTRALRTVLRTMARIAQADGTFRYGMRGSRVSQLTDYSLSVVRRAQRLLVELGLLEKVKVGGGRASTLWRIVVEKLAPAPEKTQQPPPDDTPGVPPRHGSGARGRSFLGMLGARLTGDSSPAVSDTCQHGGDARRQSNGRPRCPMCRRAPRVALDTDRSVSYGSPQDDRKGI